MSNNAMSNETDLDWLARNVHKWPSGDHQPWCYVYWKGGQRAVSGNCITVIQPCVRVEMPDWLARRAELQNKPSWDDAPEWGEWLAQDEDGEWKWLAGLPGKYVDGWTAVKIKGCCKGSALGDWRDTLEKRPEQFKPSIEEANMLAREFKPFTSIEDSQEQDMTQQHDMKQDNGWFERGELPPVGVVCEVKKYEKEEYYEVVICGIGEHLGLAVAFYEKQKVTGMFTCSSAEYFRPIRTDRELAIDEMCNVAGLDGLVFGLVAGKLYDAGYRKESK